MKIDFEARDLVLKSLCTHLSPEKYVTPGTQDLIHDTGVDFDSLSAILNYFQRVGFISSLGVHRSSMSMILHLEAFDFFNRGGFYAQEELLQKNIEKLLLEIESLKPSMPDKVNTITSIAANLATAFGLLMSR
jgi:hypothetical protein